MIRVRFAPSPTGHLHMGGVRTALFNWLYARNQNGKFILRIEDTDIKRSDQQWVENILDGFRWIGIHWDEGPYFQSERFDIYKDHFEKLKEKKQVYPCFCTQQELRAKKETHGQYLYDRRCYNLPEQEVAKRLASGEPHTYRFLMPGQDIIFRDLIHGEITKQGEEIEDFVVLRSDGTPTYNFACVIDDHQMEISHVIRAHEHIANTPKQIALYRVLELKPPKFAHIPLILGPDRKKLSKRHGAVSLNEYRNRGFLPEAMVNYLALLGWTPGGDLELMTVDTIIKKFSLKRVHRADAIFDREKLEWMNGHYIRELADEDLLKRLQNYIIAGGIATKEEIKKKRAWWLKLVTLYQPRLKKLNEFLDRAVYIFKDDYPEDKEALRRLLNDEALVWLHKLAEALEGLDKFDAESTEQVLRKLSSMLKIKASELIHPLRVKITGRTKGPGIFEVMEFIGKERTIGRLKT